MGQMASSCCVTEKRVKTEDKAPQPSPSQHTPPITNSNTDYTEHKQLPQVVPNSKNINQLIKIHSPQKISHDKNKEEKETQQKQENKVNKHAELIKLQKQKQISIKNFTLFLTLGQGGFGKVFLGCLKKDFMKSNKTMYAIKQMNKIQIRQKKVLQNLQLQKKILEESNSKFITRLHSSFRDEQYYYIVMEWAQGGDVQTFLKEGSERKKMYLLNKEESLRFILGCAILGLEHLHSKNIVFSDLKPSNILIFEDGYAKLADFGVSKQLKENSPCTFLNGTVRYFAPEMVIGTECKRQVDLWALGVLAYQMSTYDFPFQIEDIKKQERFQKVIQQQSQNRTWKNNFVSDQLKDFINSLLKLQTKKRLGANGWDEVKNHIFFKKARFDWNSLQNKTIESPLLDIISQVVDYETAIKPRVIDKKNEKGLSKVETIKNWSTLKGDF